MSTVRIHIVMIQTNAETTQNEMHEMLCEQLCGRSEEIDIQIHDIAVKGSIVVIDNPNESNLKD